MFYDGVIYDKEIKCTLVILHVMLSPDCGGFREKLQLQILLYGPCITSFAIAYDSVF